MNVIRSVALGAALVCLCTGCKDDPSTPRPHPQPRVLAEASAGLIAVLERGGVNVLEYKLEDPGVTLKVDSSAEVKQTREADAEGNPWLRASANGEYRRSVLGYSPEVGKQAALRSLSSGVRGFALTSAPCPKKVGEEWILEGVEVTRWDEKGDEMQSGTATMHVQGERLWFEVTWSDGKKVEIHPDLLQHSRFDKVDDGDLMDSTICGGVPLLSEQDVSQAEGDGSYGVGNARVAAVVAEHNRSSNVKSEFESSFQFHAEKAHVHVTKKYKDEFNDGREGTTHQVTLKIETDAFTFDYLWSSVLDDCPVPSTCVCRRVLYYLDEYIKIFDTFKGGNAQVFRSGYYGKQVRNNFSYLPCKDNAAMMAAIQKANKKVDPAFMMSTRPAPADVARLKELILKCCTSPQDKPWDAGPDAADAGLDAPVPDAPVPDLPQPDQAPPDLPVPDLPVPDLPVPDLPVPDLIPTCSSSNPQLAGAQDVASHLQANMLPSCTGLSLFETLHSKLGIAKKPVANDHTTLLAYSILLHYISISLALSAFNASDYPCGSGPNGYTLCPSASPVPAGDFVVLFSVLEKTIPLSDPTNHYQYGFVFDADGVAANNYQPSAQYPNDFFKDTDRWYEANYDPTNGWSMKVTDASGGTITPATSTSRIIIKDNAIVLVAPASELAVAKPAFRLTAFRHTGDYGINPPYNWDGSLWPAVAQGLQAFP